MSRSPLFRQVARLMHQIESEDARPRPISRRELLISGASMAAILAAGGAMGARNRPAPRIAIVGGGLAGLVCADRLRAKGYSATIYEAGSRVGGRCYSLRGLFPGQVAEYGGEFIDTGHKTMIAYAREFGLALEDVTKVPGEGRFHVNGNSYSEAQVVDEYRILVPRMRADIQTLSGEPSFANHTAADIALDQLNLRAYLESRAADLPIVREVLDAAYVSEYGRETAEQSCLNMLLFLHADRRSKFTPFGVFSDERYHVVNGNDGIAQGIRSRLPGPVELGMSLTRLSKSGGEFVLQFAGGATRRADAVVMTIPFTVLRLLTLDASLGLSADKRRAIQQLGYGDNAKTMIGFSGRPWQEVGADGSVYSDKPHLQNTWETNPSRAGATSVMTDYAGGDRGRTLANASLSTRVNQFFGDLQTVFPGIAGRHNGIRDRYHWPSDPTALGSYTCYLPGQFTGLAGLEGERAGLMYFAGEHTDSFYSWQGFMEGACLSGLRAANEVLADIKNGVL